MGQSECDVCGASFNLGADIELNELIECSDCGTEFEVTQLAPVLLSAAPQEEEDWGE